MRIKKITNSPSQTKKLAFDLAKKIRDKTVLCLYGNLGSGKTTFVQGLAEFFGVKRIISPTFVIIRTYNIEHKTKLKKLYHIDFYRLENINETKAIGIEEILKEKNSLVVIEWAEKMKELLPEKRIDIHFKYVSDREREIQIIPYDK